MGSCSLIPMTSHRPRRRFLEVESASGCSCSITLSPPEPPTDADAVTVFGWNTVTAMVDEDAPPFNSSIFNRPARDLPAAASPPSSSSSSSPSSPSTLNFFSFDFSPKNAAPGGRVAAMELFFFLFFFPLIVAKPNPIFTLGFSAIPVDNGSSGDCNDMDEVV